MLVVVITILTTLTTTIAAAYAGGDDEDGNKQKAEEESAAAIADCDDNDVERAGFDCIAIATNDVEIEPPSEERATLSVCKEDTPNLSPEDFDFTVTGNNPSPAQFAGDENCVDVTIGPGEYVVSETADIPFATCILESDCVRDPNDLQQRRATGEIQAGETQGCRFFNFQD